MASQETGNSSGRRFRKVETTFTKLESVGDAVEGTLSDKSSMAFPGGGIVGRYKLEGEDGSSQTFMGSTALDDLLENIPTGTYIRITYTGDALSKGGRKVKQYDLEVAEE